MTRRVVSLRMEGSIGRSRPTQARSRERFERILRVAGELIDELGVDRLTMEEVARRADTSIGSVYRFFANRDELLASLASVISQTALASMVDGEPSAMAGLTPEEIADLSVRMYLAFLGQHPGARGLLAGWSSLDPVLHHTMFAEVEWRTRTERFLSHHVPGMPARRRRLAADLLMRTTQSGLMVALSTAPRHQSAAFDEVRLLIASYLRALAVGD